MMGTIFKSNFLVLPVTVMLLSIAASSAFGATLTEFLARIADANDSVSYKGIFTHVIDEEVTTMKVVHEKKDGKFHERVMSLNGDASEIIRTSNGVWCYFPQKKEGYFKRMGNQSFRIPRIDSMHSEHLMKYYSTHVGGKNRLANRTTTRALFLPKDTLRYGIQLWVDDETGMPLRSDLIDSQRRVIDSYMFVEIQFEENISDNELQPAYDGKNFIWFFSDTNSVKIDDEKSSWSITSIPSGFWKMKHTKEENHRTVKEHIVFTDSLSTVSVITEKLDPTNEQAKFVGTSRLGTVNAFGRIIDEYQITVLGEVPANTVKMLGESVVKLK